MNKMKRVLASVCAVTLLAQTALVSGGMQVDAFSERQLLGETSFDYKKFRGGLSRHLLLNRILS